MSSKNGSTFVASIWAKQARFCRTMASFYRGKQKEYNETGAWYCSANAHEMLDSLSEDIDRCNKLTRKWEAMARGYEQKLRDLATAIELGHNDFATRIVTTQMITRYAEEAVAQGI